MFKKIIDTDKCTQKSNIQLNGQIWENVEYFVYLGSRVENDGRTKTEMVRRIAIASQKLSKKLSKNIRRSKQYSKLDIVKACIFPEVLYGCEAWKLLQTDLD